MHSNSENLVSKLRLLSLFAVLFLLAGCATGPQVIDLHVQPRVQASNAGQGQVVQVRVRDQRPHRIIGYLKNDDGIDKGPIIADRNVADAISARLLKALPRLGYSVRKYDGTTEKKPRLTVDLKELKYTPEAGRKVSVRAHLQAEVQAGDKRYTFSYSVKTGQRKGVLHGRDDNQELINKALNSVLESLLQDPKLIAALNGSA